METALDFYEQDRAAYLEREADALGPDGRQQLSRFNESADALMKGVQSLTGVDGIACLAELAGADAFQQGKPFKLLDENVCVKFGWEAMGMLSSARSRFLDLLQLLKDRRPGDRAKAFLQRVARCYLFGFDAECVVMCRAVLDREFAESVTDDDQVSAWWKSYETTMEGRKYKGRRPPYGQFWARIEAAQHADMISAEDRDAADAVRKRGNDAVHDRPATGQALEVVRQTVQVLDALERGRH
ncbi:MAG: DUF4145 domain-containing protein [Phycisphaerae bacterium]